ncbi:MAG: CHASE3 domain-containing protein, partial [Prochlorotrichaceae cyanobacterium]
MNMKLGNVIRVGFGVTLSLMTGLGIVSWFTTQKLNETNGWVSHTYEVIGDLKGLEKSMVDVETGQRGFLVANQENFLEPYIQGKKDVEVLIQELQSITKDNPTQQDNIKTLEVKIDTLFKYMEEVVELKRSGKEKELITRFAGGEGKRQMDSIRATIAGMVEIEANLLNQRNIDAANVSRLAVIANIGGTGSALAVGIFVLLFIGRQVVQPVNRVTDQINKSSSEIASAIAEQEHTARSQASVASQISSTIDELGASSRQSAEQALASASGAQNVLQLSEEGTKAVERTLQGMSTLQDKVAAIADQILRLSEQTSQIGSISGLVSDLANQTNMLALNAAVEAVRAGEHGKGFTVVSAEIRKLADQSKQSADKINTLVSDIQNAINSTVMATDTGTKTVQEGVRIAEETSEAFMGVTDAINNVVLNSQQISLNAKQQATAIQQVVTAISNLNQSAQETAAGIEQVKEGT